MTNSSQDVQSKLAPQGPSSLNGEFDPGSERTLAACLTHASRTRKGSQDPQYSGERVSNAWVTCPWVRNNLSKGGLIPDDDAGSSDSASKADLFIESWRLRRGSRPISLLV